MGLFKFTLILEFVPALCLAPFILIFYFIAPEKLHYNFDSEIQVSGWSVGFDGGNGALTATILIAVALWLIGTLIQTALLYFLGQKTPLGKVRIGR